MLLVSHCFCSGRGLGGHCIFVALLQGLQVFKRREPECMFVDCRRAQPKLPKGTSVVCCLGYDFCLFASLCLTVKCVRYYLVIGHGIFGVLLFILD